ncbi:hypothetical protein DSL72_002170 [Monilinia vaccinii-corymbosi]|uniref:Uncharacterized protein n=1 Tax=Monilinia vaccinii-corymbosi TaxID=61207 RepID=A0A8A3PBW5_9HELO|nr:hypothetical protein DSL72_002170 [Monilinia vaccinii-corymbosi]
MSQSTFQSPMSPQDGKTPEDILRQIYEKLPHPNDATKETSEQTELLQALLTQATSNDSKFEFVWNAVLQSIAIIFAVVFGTFSVLAYLVGETANKQSTEANQLSLLSLCLSNSDPNVKSACAGLYQQPAEPLASLASAVFGTELPTAKPTSTPTPTTVGLNPSTSASSSGIATSTTTAAPSSSPSSSKGGSGSSLNSAAIAGLTIGSILFVASVFSSIIAFRKKFHKARRASISQV